MKPPESYDLLRQYQDGNSEAATAIFDRYVERLLALARSRMGSKLKRRIDPEDVVQSAYRSFFVHARNETYLLERSGDLWRLLASIALNKLYGQIEKQTAAKRSLAREERATNSRSDLQSPDPTAAEIVALVEQLHLVIHDLSADEREALSARLQGVSIDDISKSLGKSERTVRRLIAQAKKRIEERLLTDRTVERTASKPVIEPHAPLQYADYLLQQLLGAGGMGKVYRATEKSTGNTVAIKSLHKSRQQDRRAVDQFVQEAQILTKLRHPNIVGVQGLGRFPGGGYFLVMEYVDGVDLQSRLKEGPLIPSEAVSIVKNVAIALQHAHEQGVVHCDLKPGNVLLDSSGHVYVTDFGFAHIIAGESNLTCSIGGTAGYIAPEVLSLKSPPTAASDIFALGVLLLVLFTGERPEDLDVAGKKCEERESLTNICYRCTTESPQNRYASMTELLARLEVVQIE